MLRLFGLHEIFHLLLLLYLLINQLNLLVKLQLLLFSLLDELRQLVVGLLPILVRIISDFYDALHLYLFGFEIVGQFLVYLLEYFPLPSQFVDFAPELLVASVRLVVSLIALVQAKF